MRIISGKLKGRRLLSFKAGHLRPTTDRVKEVIFNKLMMNINGADVLDLFAGTGNLSIESYSRGAERIVAVEKSSKSVSIIKANLSELKITDEIKVLPVDVFGFLRKTEESPFDIILVDPPFTQKLADKVMTAISESKVCAPDAIIVIESTKHEAIADCYSSLKLVDRKDYGDKFLSFFKNEGE